MKITHQTIKEETQYLKSVLDSGDIEIPSLGSCLWPGIGIFLWLLIWPAVASNLLNTKADGGYLAMGFGGFLGLLLMFLLVNIRSLYLSLPKEFRDSSLVIKLLVRKAKIYIAIFIAINFLSGFILNAEAFTGLLYFAITIISGMLLSFMFNADIGRYRLSAFTSAMELLKSRKQGGE